jgi:acyl-CoA synthetase (AMP-forming)/AMP-acid ligase II
MNLLMLLEMASQSFGERVAVCCQGASGRRDALSYAELLESVGRAAGALRASGAQHAALLDVTSPALPISLFASASAGLPFVPLSYRLTDPELEVLLGRIAPAFLVTDAERSARLAARTDVTPIAREDFLEGLRNRNASGTPEDRTDDPDAIAVLLFTSGTTGAPKAAVLRHRHLVSYVLGSVEFGSAAPDEATLVSVPPYHVAAVAAILSSIYAGRRIVQLPTFEARTWIERARAEQVTHAFVVPTMLARIAEALEVEGGTLPALRALSYGGGKMPLPVIARVMRLLPHVDFTNAYGLTETSSTIALLGPDEHRAAAGSGDPLVRRRLASAGRALPGVELEVRDPDGKPVATGERGEVHVRGEQVAGEYLGRGSQLAAGGWFATRDGGWLDGEGYLFLEGRIDDVIVRGGENLSPGEIEEVLLEHASVADCAVVGVPDAQWGEAVAAVVVPRAGAAVTPQELRDWVRARLRSARTPERIEFRTELPYNETGKLVRRRIRAELVGDA